MDDALDGSVVLRGVKIDLNSDIGTGFTLDCCRHVEDLITAEQLKAKYRLSEDAWRQLANNEPLQMSIERAKERRVRSGEASREKAQYLFLTAPTVLSNILNDSSASPRHRIEACRELRQATIGPEAATSSTERFSIRIDLTAGGNPDDVITINAPTRKVGPDADLEPGNDADIAPLPALIAASKGKP